MGILDEAIRDHLELKRQHGANRDELQRLEDEAFGPPSRPGEPDFPETGEAAAEAGPPATAEPPTTIIGAEGNGNHQEAEPAAAPPREPEPEPEASAEPAAPAAEPPAEEHAVLDEGTASPATPYDHSFEDELDLSDLDLDLEEPAEATPPPAAEAPPPAEATAPPDAAAPAEPSPATEEHPPEPPIESLETAEHPFEPGLSDEEAESSELAVDEPASEELEAAHPADEPPPAAEPAAAHEDDGEEGDDVLADTPEFLRDAPEDDELWFEQGEPKDFDFD